MMPQPEALAHTVRGMAIIFFLLWTVRIWPMRKRSRMMGLAFLLSAMMSLGYIKDLMFLFEACAYDIFLNDLVSLIDLLCIPLACCFFFEVTKPRGISLRTVLLLELVQASFIVVFVVWPTHRVVSCAFYFAFFITLVMLLSVIVYALRFRRYVAENFSYTETISVNWVMTVAVVYTLLYFIYYLAFDEPTWMSEAVFNLCCMLLWSFVYVLSLRHRVVEVLGEPEVQGTTADGMPSLPVEAAARRMGSMEEQEENLRRVMEDERIYLNPKLSLMELAAAMGTNRTYLSQYLHVAKGGTFYDYINTYRVEACCRLIRSMAANGQRINMAEVASQCGFNSTATFYRYFAKIKNMSPSDYYNLSLGHEGGKRLLGY
ncbi:MAG: helix-turn-helix domain-containing protein [Alloprevotella sp.]